MGVMNKLPGGKGIDERHRPNELAGCCTDIVPHPAKAYCHGDDGVIHFMHGRIHLRKIYQHWLHVIHTLRHLGHIVPHERNVGIDGYHRLIHVLDALCHMDNLITHDINTFREGSDTHRQGIHMWLHIRIHAQGKRVHVSRQAVDQVESVHCQDNEGKH